MVNRDPTQKSQRIGLKENLLKRVVKQDSGLVLKVNMLDFPLEIVYNIPIK